MRLIASFLREMAVHGGGLKPQAQSALMPFKEKYEDKYGAFVYAVVTGNH
jgi:hypothetical protein